MFSVAEGIKDRAAQPPSLLGPSVLPVALKQDTVMSMLLVSNKLAKSVLSQSANVISYY